MQVRKLISRLSEQLKQFWPVWLLFDSGFGFVVTHQAHVAINSTDHTLRRGKEPGLTKELPSIGLVLYTWVLFVTKASSLMINTAFIQGAVLLLHTPLNPLI